MLDRDAIYRQVRVIGLLAVFMSVLSCEHGSMPSIGMEQYPADFHYITKQEIRTTMAQLAVEVVALDNLLAGGGVAPAGEREEVLDILVRMRVLAGQLRRGGAKSSHPMLDDNAHRLRDDISRAIAEARMSSPPTYYEAGRVVGACTYCHVPRHDAEL